MQLLVIRHGIAENPSAVATGQDDSGPQLSKEGKQMMKRVAAGLHELVDKIDVIGASPLLRAQQPRKSSPRLTMICRLLPLRISCPKAIHLL